MTKTMRLVLYLDAAKKVGAGSGVQTRITSAFISKATGINSTQIRRDLAEFDLGGRGKGWPIKDLERGIDAHLTLAQIEAVYIEATALGGNALRASSRAGAMIAGRRAAA